MRFITEATRPFTILEASPDWLAFFGFALREVRGRPVRSLHGNAIEKLLFKQLLGEAEPGLGGAPAEPVISTLHCHTKHALSFRNHIRIEYLRDHKCGLLRGFSIRTTGTSQISSALPGGSQTSGPCLPQSQVEAGVMPVGVTQQDATPVPGRPPGPTPPRPGLLEWPYEGRLSTSAAPSADAWSGAAPAVALTSLTKPRSEPVSLRDLELVT